MTRGSYNQGFLKPGVLTKRGLTTRGSYNKGSYNQRVLKQEGLQLTVLTTRGPYNQGSYDQAFSQLGVLTPRSHRTRGS